MCGPGDVEGTYQLWRREETDNSIPAVPFSKQLLELSTELNASVLMAPNLGTSAVVKEANVEIVPLPAVPGDGFAFFLNQARRAWGARKLARRFDPDVILVQSDLTAITMLFFLGKRGRRVYEFHNTLWPRGLKLRSRTRFKIWLERTVLRATCSRFLCISEECRRQLVDGSENVRRGSLLFFPYYAGRLPVGEPVAQDPQPFRVLFAGRIEENKGVFWIVEAAAQLEREHPGAVKWTLAGSGSKLDALRGEVERRGLQRVVEVPGLLDRIDLTRRIVDCHVTLTPTTFGFAEGLAQLPLESVVVGRPAIVSSVVPAWEHLGDAVVTIRPGDAEAIRMAVATLAMDKPVYERAIAACAAAREPFLSGSYSYKTALRNRQRTPHLEVVSKRCPQVAATDTGLSGLLFNATVLNIANKKGIGAAVKGLGAGWYRPPQCQNAALASMG